MSEANRSDSKVPVLVAVIGACALIVAASIPFICRSGGSDDCAERASGRITSPESGEAVPRGFVAAGRLACIPSGNHVWLAVQVGNPLTPKEPEISAEDRRWTHQFSEGGVRRGDTFTLVLLMVDAVGQRAIEAWLRRGHRTGRFPPFDRIPGTSSKLWTVGDVMLR